MMRMWLVGMMGAGKTAAGAAASEALGVPFYDTDQEIAARLGCSVPQLWGERGEAAFRELERTSVQRLASKQGLIATGGGVVMDPMNREVMKGSGMVVWLSAVTDTLVERLDGLEDRPLLAQDVNRAAKLGQISDERQLVYEEVADEILATDGLTVAQVAEKIGELWHS